MQLRANGKIRSFAVGRCTDSTFLKVFNNKNSKIGSITVRTEMENNSNFINSIGRYLGDFAKKKVVPKSGMNKGWKM